MSPAIVVVRNQLRVAAMQTTLTVAAGPPERASDAKDRRDPSPHTGQAAAHFQGPPEGPLVGTGVLQPRRGEPLQGGSPRLTAQPCQGDRGFPKARDTGWRGTRNRKHGAKPGIFTVAPSVLSGRGAGAQVRSGATPAGSGWLEACLAHPGSTEGIPEAGPTPCKLQAGSFRYLRCSFGGQPPRRGGPDQHSPPLCAGKPKLCPQ